MIFSNYLHYSTMATPYFPALYIRSIHYTDVTMFTLKILRLICLWYQLYFIKNIFLA